MEYQVSNVHLSVKKVVQKGWTLLGNADQQFGQLHQPHMRVQQVDNCQSTWNVSDLQNIKFQRHEITYTFGQRLNALFKISQICQL